MPPKGWRKPKEEVRTTPYLEPTKYDKSFTPFGDRLDFLSPEQAQLHDGKMRLLPARFPRKKEEDVPQEG